MYAIVIVASNCSPPILVIKPRVNKSMIERIFRQLVSISWPDSSADGRKVTRVLMRFVRPRSSSSSGLVVATPSSSILHETRPPPPPPAQIHHYNGNEPPKYYRQSRIGSSAVLLAAYLVSHPCVISTQSRCLLQGVYARSGY